MDNSGVRKYIQQQMHHGVPKETVRTQLVGAGWTGEFVDKTLSEEYVLNRRQRFLVSRFGKVVRAGIIAEGAFYLTLLGIMTALFVLGALTGGALLVFLVILYVPTLLLATAAYIGYGRTILRQHDIKHATLVPAISICMVVVLGLIFLRYVRLGEPGIPLIAVCLGIMVPVVCFVAADASVNSTAPKRTVRRLAASMVFLALVIGFWLLGVLYHPNMVNDERLRMAIQNSPFTLYSVRDSYPQKFYDLTTNSSGIKQIVLVKGTGTVNSFYEYRLTIAPGDSIPCYEGEDQPFSNTCRFIGMQSGMRMYAAYEHTDTYGDILSDYAVLKGTTFIIGSILDKGNHPDKAATITLFNNLVGANPQSMIRSAQKTHPDEY